MVDEIYKWYKEHRRELPWRLTRDPYLIWVSEIILQQTRISQGLPYYLRFIGKFPDVFTLASAPEDELLKVWEGLGYYSRARNMHAAAKAVVSQYGGEFPKAYESLLGLKGIGTYTAAAVASIAFGLPHAVVDGNVIRFLSRYFGIEETADTTRGRTILNQAADDILLRDDPGFHNEAIMEFGALCCIPGKPDCLNCPVNAGCVALQEEKVSDYPVKSKKMKRKVRYFSFCIFEAGDRLLLEKRTGKDIWKNLWQFPVIESVAEIPDHELLSVPYHIISDIHQPVVTEVSPTYQQELTHQSIKARFIRVSLTGFDGINQGRLEVNRKEIHTFAYPVLIRNYLAKMNWPKK